jgi:hypothetical protein
MKKINFFILVLLGIITFTGCDNSIKNTTALEEQNKTENNQKRLNAVQPAPSLSWSMERDALIKRNLLMNDRSVVMYMYVFIEGVGKPIGYYIVNKVSSVNSQLTNPKQIIKNSSYESGSYSVIPSPAEDGSYGDNGDGVFGFTPDGLYIEHNMKYMVATAPLKFAEVPMIGEISIKVKNELQNKLKSYENKIR